jgi:hypothetical protein
MQKPRKPFAASYWIAPGALVLGIANLARATYYAFQGSVSYKMFAAGGTLLAIGLMATYYAWDDYHDWRIKMRGDDEEDLSAEEYEKRFEEP